MISGTIAVGVFVLVYLILLAGESSPRKLDRPAAGLIGGVLMVLLGVLSRTEALSAIDFSTLALLFGMMVLIHFATACGLLEGAARRLVGRASRPTRLLWSVCLGAGVLSALFVNDTVCLLMTPLLLTTTRRARIPARPYLLALATSSNAGSVMTLTGNPQNMLIGQSSGWGWGAFALRMIPVGLVCLGLNYAVLRWVCRKELSVPPSGPAAVEDGHPLDRRLAAKTILVLCGMLAAFLAGAPMDLSALTAAVVLLAWANRPPEEAFAAVDWSLLLFFAGLFVVVGGVTKTQGAWIARAVPLLTHHNGSLGQLAGFSTASVAGSNLFSNVPFVMLLRHWISGLPRAGLLWLALAASSTLAGNLTLVGSVANLIVAQGARDECPLSFWSFLRVGVASTLLTVAAAVLILWAYGVMGWA
jgi:Na+/H+ antiporter NhaD/arsenite permease-like protein